MRNRTVLLALALLAGGCGSQPVAPLTTLFQGKGAPALSAGIGHFEEGRYAQATKSLTAALEQGLASTADLAKARKYLAFIHCASNRVQQCREEFAKALDANPGMELEPTEAGHPMWGPVFKSVKARR